MKRLLLVGAGHAHLHVLRALARARLDDVRVTLVNPFRRCHYSGMVPGYLQGTYAEAELAIDLVEEIDLLPNKDDVVTDALLLFQESRRNREQGKLTALLGRKDVSAGEQDEVFALRKLSELAALSNKRRIM